MVTKTVYAESSFCSGYTDYCALSNDDQPTEGIAENSLLLLLDTGEFYYFTGGEWVKVGTAPVGGGGNDGPVS